MTETEWLADKPRLLERIRYLSEAQRINRTNLGKRRLRLFACACARRVWPLLEGAPERREQVEVAERFVEGQATAEELARACVREPGANYGTAEAFARYVPWYLCDSNAAHAARWASVMTLHALTFNAWQRRPAEDRGLLALFRDIFGNPFRPVILEPAWRRANDSAAGSLARAIYDERAFDRLPILADALEDAGCADEVILSHCRGPGPHVRGCWVVDRILGKS